ncbi:BLUF domain-containing protein [Erythrobacter donghaensis]|uniref:BLUF domain-containing protein n=1 Tax=Erythrobacter donghaensis TaxID=267135 RepID=UPI00130248BA|nr:BLUF domain-containing protein [Erythrobacter donghaensis]
MRRIIYRSTATPELDRAELFRLLYHARASNEARGLTGVLMCAGNELLQVLEGPTWKLVATFEAIRRDPRHCDVAVLDERSIDAATFAGWPMRYFDDHDICKAVQQMTEKAGGILPPTIGCAVSDFFVEAFVDAEAISPAPPEAALPSSPRPC